VLRAVNIRQLSPNQDRSSIYHIFERLNTGGTPLSPQEIRNTVYRGDIVDALQAANLDVQWRAIFGREDLDRRERDTEIILRLLGLFLKGIEYERPMKRFLNDTMHECRALSSEDVQSFFKQWPQITAFLVENLGERPFNPRGPLNVAVLDAVFTTVARRWPKEPTNIKETVDGLLKSEKFMNLCSARTGDTEVVRDRLKLADQAIFG